MITKLQILVLIFSDMCKKTLLENDRNLFD